MQLRKGATRYVILVGSKSMKIGKVRPFRTFSKLISLAFSERRRINFKEEYGSNFLLALWRFMIVGIWANRNEFFYYQKYKDTRVIPTTQIFLFGMISIQERGLSVTEFELERNHPLDPSVVNRRNSDLRDARQYCFCKDGVIRVVDYGNKGTCDVLMLSLKT